MVYVLFSSVYFSFDGEVKTLLKDFPSVDLAFGKAKAYPVVTILFCPRNKFGDLVISMFIHI
uniref:Uncharacterized protein n=1 Tax=Solanum tuberosum TaxID=4113 RepID=M1BN08_SOLTU